MQACKTVDPGKLHRLCVALLISKGALPDEAEVVADSLVESDMADIHSHGVSRMKLYLDCISAGGMSARYRGEVIADHPATALIDAQGSLGIVAATKAMELAIKKARQTGIGLVNVRASNHCGALRYIVARGGRTTLLPGTPGPASSSRRPSSRNCGPCVKGRLWCLIFYDGMCAGTYSKRNYNPENTLFIPFVYAANERVDSSGYFFPLL